MNFLWILLVAGAFSFTISSKGSTDPGTLTWSKETWTSNPVSLSTSNAGSLATLTFNFNPTTSVTAGVFCVNLPAGFTVSSNCVTNINIEAAVDTSVDLPSVTLPSAPGVYGPFAIFTQVSANGNILDLNLNFGLVYITTSVSSQSLTVSLGKNTIQTSTSVIFGFKITVDMWLYDFFEITIPSSFTVASPVCNSLSSTNVTYLTGADPSDITSLQCYASDGVLYIYGIRSEINLAKLQVSSLSLSLEVSGFTTPIAAYSTSSITWELRTRRFGTYATNQWFTATGPKLNPQSLQINWWLPHTAQSIVAGKFTYMDIVFTLTNDIPIGGSITFGFTNANVDSISWKSDKTQTTSSSSAGYYYFSPSIPGTCSISNNNLNCNRITTDVTAAQYTLTILPVLSSTYASVVISTADINGNNIDLSSVYQLNYTNNSQLISSMSLLFSPDDSGAYSAYSNSSVIGYLSIKSPVIIPLNTIITLTLPIASGLNTDFTFGTESTFKANYWTSTTKPTSYASNHASLLSLQDPVVSKNKITFNSPLTASASQYLLVYFTSDSGSTLPGLTLPYVSSNMLTRYEILISYIISNIEYVYASPLTIISAPMTSISANLLCTDYTFAGLPLSISFTPPFNYSTNSGTLYIDIELTSGYLSDLGSGLNVGNNYSVESSIVGATFALQDKKITISGLKSISTTAYSLEFPIGSSSTSSIVGAVRIYYTTSLGLQNEIMLSSVSITGGSATNSNFRSSSTATTYVNNSISVPYANSIFDLEIVPIISSGATTTGYFGVVFPAGYSFSSPVVYLTSDNTKVATILYVFNSTTSIFAFPGIYFALSSSISIGSSITISGIIAPISGFKGVLKFIQSPSSTGSCTHTLMSTNPNIVIAPLSFTSTSFLPSSLTTLSSGSLITNVTANLVVPTIISNTSVIVLTFAWNLTTFSSFDAQGLGSSYSITNSGQVLTITGFPEIESQATISVDIYNALAPKTASDTSHFSTIYIYSDNTLKYKTVSYEGTSTCQLYTSSVTGYSSYSIVSVIPNAVTLPASIVHLEFTLMHSLPITSIISINSATGSWSISAPLNLNIWSSIQYSSCSANSTALNITLSEAYTAGTTLQFTIDNAITLPSTSGSTLKGFTVTTYFAGIIVDKDNTISPSSLQQLNVKSLPSSTITQNSTVSIKPTTIGEAADYTFNFTSSAILSTSNTIIFIFSKTFDAFLGNAALLFSTGLPNTYFIACESNTTGMQYITCKVNHWILSVTGITGNIANGTLINIVVSGIKNPVTMGKIGVYVLGSLGNVITYNSNLNVVSTTGLGSNLVIKSININDYNLRDNATYTFQLYLTSSVVNGTQILVQFPNQYNLVGVNNTIVACNSSNWIIATGLCNMSNNNRIIIPVNASISSTTLVNLTLTLTNPAWGFTVIDLVDSSAGFKYWTNKFELGVLSSGGHILKSYGQHPGFIGLNDIMLPISINSYSAIDNSNPINVKPGAQTTGIIISISNHLEATKLVLSPSNAVQNTATLSFSSTKNFTITKDLTSIEFSVSAPENSRNSLNYIVWTIEETSLNGTNRYVVPYETLVTIYNYNPITITLTSGSQSTLQIPSGSTGLPLQLYNPSPPSSDLTISFFFMNSSIQGISFIPSSVTFNPGEQYKYFAIQVNSSFNGSVNYNYYYSLVMTGTNILAYNALSMGVFQVVSSVKNILPVITSLNFANVMLNSLDIQIISNADCQIYWEFCQNNTAFSTYAQLTSKVYPLTSQTSTNINLDDQITNYLLGLQPSPKTSQTWEKFQKNMYAYSSQTCFYSTNALLENKVTTIFSPYFLWAETVYKVNVFAVNLQGNYTSLTITTTTATMQNPAEISLSLGGDSSMSLSSVTSDVALSLGVVTNMLSDVTSSGRRLYSSVNLILNADRSSNTNPLTISMNINTELLDSLLGTGCTVSAISLDPSTYQVPSGTFGIKSINLDSITVNGTFTDPGRICCIVEIDPNPNTTLFNQQVYVGVDRTNANALSNCTDIITNLTLVINGLSPNTTYNVSCISTTSYPAWPKLSGISKLSAVTIITNNPFVASFAVIIQFVTLLVLNLV